MSPIRISSFIAIILGVSMVIWGRWLQKPLDQPPANFNPADLRFVTSLTMWGVVIAVLGCWGFARPTGALDSPKAARFAGVSSIAFGSLILLGCVAWAAGTAAAFTSKDPALLTITGMLGLPALFGLLIGTALLFSGIRALRRSARDARSQPEEEKSAMLQ